MRWRDLGNHFGSLDWILILAALLLVGMGLLSLYSSSLGQGDFLNFKKQLIFLSIGFFLMMVVSLVDWRQIKNDPFFIFLLYFLCCLLLFMLFFFAPEIRGTKSWYRIGPVSLDPIEPTKIVLILLLAKYFSLRHVEMYRIRHILLSGFYIALPSVLIFFQPNLGSVMILILVWIAILVLSGIKLRHFLILTLCGLLVLIFSWQFLLKEYQKERVLSFVMPELQPQGIGWSHQQAKIAIGSGGIFGKGIGQGTQTQYGFLPEPQTDFIFSALAEETGLFGISFLFLLFSILIWRILRVCLFSQSNFPRLFSIGFGVLLISQIFIHIGMNLGILPIIGISLPLVSYGGSSLISTYIGLGLILAILKKP
jgi:rod shape determining protein RodA